MGHPLLSTEKLMSAIPVSIKLEPFPTGHIRWSIYVGHFRVTHGVVEKTGLGLSGDLHRNLRQMELPEPMRTHLVDEASALVRKLTDTGAVARAAWAETFEADPSEFDETSLRRGSWDCPKSPDKVCWYDSTLDPCWDQCIFCGDPDERK